jgi:undecaprenyl-diphosphatase
LPKPPKAGSLAEKAELKSLHLLERFRTEKRDERVRQLNHDGTFKAYWDMAAAYRDGHGFLQGIAGTALLGTTLAANTAVTAALKLKNNRQRPFDVDPSLHPLFHPKDPSYPSGHASTAFAAARVMSKLDPSMTKSVYAYATEMAASRTYAGVHFPSDVVAGAAVGTAVASKLLQVLRIK